MKLFKNFRKQQNKLLKARQTFNLIIFLWKMLNSLSS